MKLLFCTDPLDRKSPDAMYADEYSAARAVGFEVGLISVEPLYLDNDLQRAVERVSSSCGPGDASDATALYRGWMLKPGHYAAPYRAVCYSANPL